MTHKWETFTDRLVWAMEHRGKTNKSALAREVGVKPQSIQYLTNAENGAQGSSFTTSLAKALNVSSRWLEGNEGSPEESAAGSSDELSNGLLKLGSMLIGADIGTRRAVAALLTGLAEAPDSRSATVRKIVALLQADEASALLETKVPHSVDVSVRPGEDSAKFQSTTTGGTSKKQA